MLECDKCFHVWVPDVRKTKKRRRICPACGYKRSHKVPSPDEIASDIQEIQDGWTDRERYAHQHGSMEQAEFEFPDVQQYARGRRVYRGGAKD